MKASECLKKPGDVARRKSDDCIAQYTDNGCAAYLVPHGKLFPHGVQGVGRFTGDDWTPLAPQTPIEELQRYRMDWKCWAGFPCETGEWVKFCDLQSVALVRDNPELQVQLDAAIDERDAANRALSESSDQYVELRRLMTAKELENRKLRQQLEGQYVLGEPIAVGTTIPSNTPHYSLNDDGELHLRCHETTFTVRPAHVGRKFACPWVEPIVELPEPEPVVEVPKWPLAAVKVLSSNSAWMSGGIGFVVDRVADKGMWCVCVDGMCGWVNERNLELYTSPVKHPDGTIAPIEPSPELVEALKGAKDE